MSTQETCAVCNFAPEEDCPRTECPHKDTTPWCHICGSMTRQGCDCPPPAENE